MSNFREERIEKLLKELEYEIKRGLIENEIAEEFSFRFYALSRKIPNGMVFCEFHTRPIPSHMIYPGDIYNSSKLRVVK